jgi:hypothetical protein
MIDQLWCLTELVEAQQLHLIANVLMVGGLTLLAWIAGFLVFAFLTGGPHGATLRTMLLIAMIPATPVSMTTVAVLIYRRHPRSSSN